MQAKSMFHVSNTYQLLDSGNFKKLEQFGSYRLVRPALQAIWKPFQSIELWKTARAHYHRSKSGGGRWEYNNKLPSHWNITYYDLTLKIKLTNFGHLGFFAEQGPNWQWIQEQIRTAGRPIKVLNIFAYTGGSSLAAAAAGASVTHVDSAKGIVSWAQENAELSSLADKPIRWLIDDALKFAAREVRRSNKYDAIILDPPSFGRGPKGEIWKFERDLPKLLEFCRSLLSEYPLFVLLSAHTPGFTPLALENLLCNITEKFGGHVTSMEMVIPESETNRCLPSGILVRWIKN
jgi:23S rRNA (cytosine1962-C5)-methyltransferase